MIPSRDERANKLLNGSEIASDAVYALDAAELGTLNDYRKQMLTDAIGLCQELVTCAKQSEDFRATLQPGVRWAVQACENVYYDLPDKTFLDDSDAKSVVPRLEKILQGIKVPSDEISELQDFFHTLAQNLGEKLCENPI